jgi:hypothetical protein
VGAAADATVLCEEDCAAPSEGPRHNAVALNSGKQSNKDGEEILSFMDCADAGAMRAIRISTRRAYYKMRIPCLALAFLGLAKILGNGKSSEGGIEALPRNAIRQSAGMGAGRAINGREVATAAEASAVSNHLRTSGIAARIATSPL